MLNSLAPAAPYILAGLGVISAGIMAALLVRARRQLQSLQEDEQEIEGYEEEEGQFK